MDGMASQVSLDTQSNVTEELIPERRLWTVVLVNAVEDWRGDAKLKSFFLNLTWTSRSFAPAQDWTPEIFARDY